VPPRKGWALANRCDWTNQNPSWAPFSAAGYADGIDLASDVLVVRVWRVRAEGDVESGSGGSTAGETAAAAAAMTARLVTSHGFGGRTSSRALVEDSMVLFEWVVDFRALVFLGVEVKPFVVFIFCFF